jgi:MFS superfamily sulfate permease-like transporter
MVRFDAPLFFANAPEFGRRLQQKLRGSDRHIDMVLIVGNAITDIDTTGAEILGHLLEDLEAKGIQFAFAGLKGPVKDRLRSYELYDRVGDDFFYANTISAVQDFKRNNKQKG